VNLVFPSFLSLADKIMPSATGGGATGGDSTHMVEQGQQKTPVASSYYYTPCTTVRSSGSSADLGSGGRIAPPEASILAAYRFWGALAGLAVRSNVTLSLDFSPTVWRPLVGRHMRLKDIHAVDEALGEALSTLRNVIHTDTAVSTATANSDYPDGRGISTEQLRELSQAAVSLLGPHAPPHAYQAASHVTLSTLPEFFHYLQGAAVRRGNASAFATAFYCGLSTVLPTELFLLWTPTELSRLLTGEPEVSVSALQRMSVLDANQTPTPQQLSWLWETLEGWNNEQRTLFLHFVTARMRVPSSPLKITLKSVDRDAKRGGAKRFFASTCYLTLTLGFFDSREEFSARLLDAVSQPAFFSNA